MNKTMKQELPALATIAEHLSGAKTRLDDMLVSFERRILADRLWIGVCCLAAQEQHALAVTEVLDRKGKGKNQNRVTRDTISEPTPALAHPQGFAGWLDVAAPWLNRATAYKYMDAARGAGLTSRVTLDEVRDWTTEMLGRDPALTLKSLVDAGRKLLPGGKEEPGAGDPDWVQMTWDSIFALQDHRDKVLAHRDRMTPTQYKRACAEAYKTLRDLTDQPWAPSKKDHEEFIKVIEDPRKVGR